jgi:hypothetical protein
LSDNPTASGHRSRWRRLLFGTAIACALVVGLVVGAVVYRELSDDNGDGGDSTFPTEPVASSVEGLQAFATAIGHPVYWAGAMQPYTYELRLTKQGRIFVRYLPKGVAVGDPRALFLTVATYPVANAVAALRGAVSQGGVRLQTGDDGFAYYDRSKPTSVYYARSSSPNYEVEVFDPSPSRARSLVLGGRIRPIG